MPNRALSPATRMSVAWRISVPPAMAGPSTAAISGLVSRRPLSSGSSTAGSKSDVARVGLVHGLQVGAGAERAACPVSTQARMPGSLSTWSQARASPPSSGR